MRQSWDDYFLDMARHVASRSTCVRRKVGAVIVQDRQVRATGYNGSPSGYGHCNDGACPRSQAHPTLDQAVDGALSRNGLTPEHADCIAIHAEANAILQCGPERRERATMYCTDFPCFACAKLIANSGITQVCFVGGAYEGWEGVRRFLLDCNVRVPSSEVMA